MQEIFSALEIDHHKLREALTGHSIYLVGGSVRDLVLGRPIHDYDFAVQTGAIKLAFQVGDALRLPAFVLDEARDIGRVMLADGVTTLDFARFRRADGTFGETLEEDLWGRDFTMNAIALDVAQTNSAESPSYIDPTQGLCDIEHSVVRMTHARAIEQDPARALRALRMALGFGFEMAAETQAAVRGMAGGLGRISAERVRDEFLKLLSLDGSIATLQKYGLLHDIVPEVNALTDVAQSSPHTKDVFWHTVSVLHWLSQLEHGQSAVNGIQLPTKKIASHLQQTYDGGYSGVTLLQLGALLHDIGKAKTQTVEQDGRIRFSGHEGIGAQMAERRMKQLKFSRAATQRVRAIVKGHMRPLFLAQAETLTPRAVYRYFNKLGDTGVEIALLSLADHLGTYDGVGDALAWQRLTVTVAQLLDYFFERQDVVKPVALINGGDLIEMGMKPGRVFGRILAAITEAQAAGEVTTRQQALTMAREIAIQATEAAKLL